MDKSSIYKISGLALLALAVMSGSAVVYGQTSQAATNSTGTPVGQESSTDTSTLQPSCGPQSNSTSTAQAGNTTGQANATGTASNQTQGTANSNTTTSGTNGGMNVTTILSILGEARLHIMQGCDAANTGDNQAVLMHLNEVARALDNIEGNLTQTTTASNATGATSGSSVQDNMATPQGSGNQSKSGDFLDQLKESLGIK